MSQIKKTCNICSTVFKINSYGQGECPQCGVLYSYGEDYRIVLTSFDVAAIRTQKEIAGILKN